MYRISFFLFLCICLGLFGCQSENFDELLWGNWIGAYVEEEGTPMNINPAELKLIFDQEGRYQYYSTLSYREVGYFQVKFPLLLTKDTLHMGATEKKVEIAYLTTDSLILKMEESEKVRKVVFRKE